MFIWFLLARRDATRRLAVRTDRTDLVKKPAFNAFKQVAG